jgi:hypothetical protein
VSHAYRTKGTRGLLIKTLFQTGARVSEFVNIKAEEFFFEEQVILLAKAKGGESRLERQKMTLPGTRRTVIGTLSSRAMRRR